MLIAPFAVFAQQSSVLTLNQEALYLGSDFGKRVQRELEQASRELAAENREIEVALIAEERALTQDRPNMEPKAFRALAEEFDTRVTEIRQAQDLKRNVIQQRVDAERARFFELAFPFLLRLVEESGAVAILDDSAVIFSVRNIDITQRAIADVNQNIGEAPLPAEPNASPTPRPEISQPSSEQDDASD